jgi:membrane protease YdiL (CAAX protease family)
VEPFADESLPAARPRGTKSALAFFGVLLALFPLALLSQWASPVAGLVATQLAAFLLPALVATAGSNLRLAPWLRLAPPRPSLLLLGALCGGSAYVVAGSIMTFTQRLLPRAWVQTYDLTRLFEGPAWERIALAAVAALLAPVCEELTFRGYLQSTLALRRSPAVAIAAGAFLFAALHLDPVRFPALLVLGAVFGWLAWRAGSVWPAVAAHAANNGLAAGLLLVLGATEAPGAAPPGEVATTLAAGLCLLGLSVAAYRAAAPPPGSAAPSVVLADPASPDLRWRLERVPRRLALAALAGGLALILLALAGIARGITAPRAP